MLVRRSLDNQWKEIKKQSPECHPSLVWGQRCWSRNKGDGNIILWNYPVHRPLPTSLVLWVAKQPAENHTVPYVDPPTGGECTPQWTRRSSLLQSPASPYNLMNWHLIWNITLLSLVNVCLFCRDAAAFRANSSGFWVMSGPRMVMNSWIQKLKNFSFSAILNFISFKKNNSVIYLFDYFRSWFQCMDSLLAHGLSSSETPEILVLWSGIKHASPALQGRFLTTRPPAKFLNYYSENIFWIKK